MPVAFVHLGHEDSAGETQGMRLEEDWAKKGRGPLSPAVTVDRSRRDPVKAGAGTVRRLNNVVSW